MTRRIAIVTGAASGVGAATALLLAQHGHDVLLNYNRSAHLVGEAVDACCAAGADAFAVQGDVSSDNACRAIARGAVQRWGRIDALVHSAGATRFVPVSNLEGVNAQDFHDIFGINTIGAFQMARACTPHMGPGSAIVSAIVDRGAFGQWKRLAVRSIKGGPQCTDAGPGPSACTQGASQRCVARPH